MSQVKIIKVNTDNDLKKFIDLPHIIYKSDPNYVPELYIQVKKMLDKNKNAFFEHASADYFIALKDNQTVGRIAAVKDDHFIEFNKSKTAIFGFFDSINDKEIAHLLLNTAVDWAKEQGLSKIMGPSNLSTNNTSFLLIDGFKVPPYIMMSYNKPYYQELIESFGFVKEVDTLAYSLPTALTSNDRFKKIQRLSKTIEPRLQSKGIVIRNFNLKDFNNEVRIIKEIYNNAWEKSMDFVPMTDKEVDQMAKELKPVLNPKYAFLAFHNEKPIGISITIPDINQRLIKIKNGRLFPTGIFKLLNISSIKYCRVIIQGVIEDYRHLGIDVCFISKLTNQGNEDGIIHTELSWILEHNYPVINMFENMGLKIYKKYRLYCKDI
ncbi:MAG: GNAT family N-acetyltransferase [Solitalea-like symbiont of Tyrophagus putrescentiae]